jgi:hypothetical protein
MMASTLRLIPPVRHQMSCCGSCCHSRYNALPTDEWFAKEVPEPVYDGITCPKYALYLSWLQAGFSHHTRQPNWWSVHQRRLASSCCPPFWQPPTSYKACVYGWHTMPNVFVDVGLPTFNDSPWLKFRWCQTLSNCCCWHTSIGQPVLFEYVTGCEWQTLQCPPITHYSKFSMLTLLICVFKSGVLKHLFILSKHGTKANIRSTKMANNRHAYNRDVIHSSIFVLLIFAFVPCLLRMNKCFKTPDLNTQIRSVSILNFE